MLKMSTALSSVVIVLMLSNLSLAQPTTAPTTQRSIGAGEAIAADDEAPIRVTRAAPSGAPRGQGTAASRGGKGVPTPILFAEPDDAGFTLSSNPTICFYVAEPTKSRAVVTLSDAMEHTTVGAVWFREGFSKAGVHRVQMTDLKEPLRPGALYSWIVSIYSPSNNNDDNAAAVAVMRFEPNAELSQRIANLTPVQRARVLGENAYWYDAIAALSEAIEADPSNQFLRAQRTALLTDRKKENAASFEKIP